MKPHDALPLDDTRNARWIVLEAPPSDAREQLLADWLATESRDRVAAWNLPCDAAEGGPWAGVKHLLWDLVPRLESAAPELIERHAAELCLVLPTLRRQRLDVGLSLTDVAVAEEKVRNYPMDRAYRIVHGLVDLLTAWHEVADFDSWTIVCDDYDRSGALGGRFFRELARRAGERLDLTMVFVGSPGSFEAADFQDLDDVLFVRPQGIGGTRPVVSPARMGERAQRLQETIGEDYLAEAEHLAELVSCWHRSDTPEKALPYQALAFAEYNHQGFYEDALPYGEVVLRHLDELTQQTEFTRWNLVGALANCHLALRQPERALEIVDSEAVGKIDDPTDRARICYVLALIYSRFLSDPDFDRAEAYLDEGLDLLSGDSVPLDQRIFLRVFTLNGLAFIRFRQQRPEDALELCRSGFEELERHLPATQHRLHRSVLLYNTAQVYATLQAYPEAIEYFTEAIAMDGNYSEYFNERGNVYLEIGDIEAAIADYHAAIERSAPYYEVWTNLGQALKLTGRVEEARAAYDRAIDIDPIQVLPRLGRAQANELLGDLPRALQDYSAALEVDPEQPQVLANRASILFECGRPIPAIADLDRAVVLDPENAALYYNRSVALESGGRLSAAVDDLRAYLELQPDAADGEDVRVKIASLEATLAGRTAGRPIPTDAVVVG